MYQSTISVFSNVYGQLGDGTTASKKTPTQIGSATNWSAISAGYRHVVALRSDGTLWAWGFNGYGQLGDGNTGWRVTHAKESTGANNWVAISAGYNHTVALKTSSDDIPLEPRR